MSGHSCFETETPQSLVGNHIHRNPNSPIDDENGDDHSTDTHVLDTALAAASQPSVWRFLYNSLVGGVRVVYGLNPGGTGGSAVSDDRNVIRQCVEFDGLNLPCRCVRVLGLVHQTPLRSATDLTPSESRSATLLLPGVLDTTRSFHDEFEEFDDEQTATQTIVEMALVARLSAFRQVGNVCSHTCCTHAMCGVRAHKLHCFAHLRL